MLEITGNNDVFIDDQLTRTLHNTWLVDSLKRLLSFSLKSKSMDIDIRQYYRQI